jgi:hypothetical protein
MAPEASTESAEQTRWTAMSPIPATCTDAELYRGLGLSRSTFYRLKASGAFTFLELKPALVGAHTQYSGHLIAKWLRGDLEAGKPRTFFNTAARRASR